MEDDMLLKVVRYTIVSCEGWEKKQEIAIAEVMRNWEGIKEWYPFPFPGNSQIEIPKGKKE